MVVAPPCCVRGSAGLDPRVESGIALEMEGEEEEEEGLWLGEKDRM